MKVQRVVSRRKFDREVTNIFEQKDSWQKKGCLLLNASFPYVDALFMPQRARIELPALTSRGNHLQMAIMGIEHPGIVGRPFGVRIDMEDYDMRAPSVTFRDPYTWELARIEHLPEALFIDSNGISSKIMLGGHQIFDRPFLCIEGLLEYHAHPQHTDRDWFAMRSDFSLYYILDTIWTTCCVNTFPRVLLSQPTVNFGWAPSRMPEAVESGNS